MWFNLKKDRQRQNRIVLPIIFLLAVIIMDQWTKFLAVIFLTKDNEVLFFSSFFKFSLVQNHGGFLGVIDNLSETWRFFLLIVCVSVLLIICLLYLLGFNKTTPRYDIPLALVIGGGIGNLVDRLLHNGGVTDFLSIGIGNFRTGIFNLADVSILIGSFILGYAFFSSPSRNDQPRVTEP